MRLGLTQEHTGALHVGQVPAVYDAGFDDCAAPDRSRIGSNGSPERGDDTLILTQSLDESSDEAPIIGFDKYNQTVTGDITHTLDSGGSKHREPLVAYSIYAHNSEATVRHAKETDVANTTDGQGGYTAGQGGTLVFHERRGAVRGRPNETERQLETQAELAYCLESQTGRQQTLAQPLRSHNRNNSNPTTEVGMHVRTRTGLRRLTPTECLRLQALPDDWLDLDPPLSDGAKYRMIGNSITTTVSHWLGKRIRRFAPQVRTYVSLFAGIGGFDLGLDQAGLQCLQQVEIDPACLRVLAKHWPNVPKHADVRTFCK